MVLLSPVPQEHFKSCLESRTWCSFCQSTVGMAPQEHKERIGTLAKDDPAKPAVPTSNGKRVASLGYFSRENFDLKKVKIEPGVWAEEGPDVREAVKQNGQARAPGQLTANRGSRPVLNGGLKRPDSPRNCFEKGMRTRLSKKKQDAYDYFHATVDAALQNRLIEFMERNPPGGMDKDAVAEVRQQWKYVKREVMRLKTELTRKDEELTRKDEELTRKEKEFSEKEEELTRKKCELAMDVDARVQLQDKLNMEVDARAQLQNTVDKEMDARIQLQVKLDLEVDARVQLQNQLNMEVVARSQLQSKLDMEVDARIELQNKLDMQVNACNELQDDYDYLQKRKATLEGNVQRLENRIGRDEVWMEHIDWKLVPRMSFEQVADLFGRLSTRLLCYDREHSDDLFDESVCPDFAGMFAVLRQKMTKAMQLEREQTDVGKEIQELKADKEKYAAKATKLRKENKSLAAENENYLKTATAQQALLSAVTKEGHQLASKVGECSESALQARRQQAWHEMQLAAVCNLNLSMLKQDEESKAERRMQEKADRVSRRKQL